MSSPTQRTLAHARSLLRRNMRGRMVACHANIAISRYAQEGCARPTTNGCVGMERSRVKYEGGLHSIDGFVKHDHVGCGPATYQKMAMVASRHSARSCSRIEPLGCTNSGQFLRVCGSCIHATAERVLTRSIFDSAPIKRIPRTPCPVAESPPERGMDTPTYLRAPLLQCGAGMSTESLRPVSVDGLVCLTALVTASSR